MQKSMSRVIRALCNQLILLTYCTLFYYFITLYLKATLLQKLDNFVQQYPETDWLSALRAWRYYRDHVVKADQGTQADRRESDGHVSNDEHEDDGRVESCHSNEDNGHSKDQNEDDCHNRDQYQSEDKNEGSGCSKDQNEDNGHNRDQSEDKNEDSGQNQVGGDIGATDSAKQSKFINHQVAQEFSDVSFRVTCTKVAPSWDSRQWTLPVVSALVLAML